MPKYQVEYYRTDTKRYFVDIESDDIENDDEIQDKVNNALDDNGWSCKFRGKGGNCVHGEDDIQDIKKLED